MNDPMHSHIQAERLRYTQTLEARLRLMQKFVPIGALFLEQERFEGWQQPKICCIAAPCGTYLRNYDAMQIHKRPL